MQSYSTRIGQIVYNPATSAFEALVTFQEGFEETRYACALDLPIDTDPQAVALALIAEARAMRRADRRDLVSKLRSHPALTSPALARRISAAVDRRAA